MLLSLRSTDLFPFLIAFAVFFVSLGALHKLGIQSVVWGLLYAGVALLALTDFDRVMKVSVDYWWLWIAPTLALASTLWSIEPFATLEAALVYMYTTLLGVVLGMRLSPLRIFSALFLAAGLAVFLSLGVNFLMPEWSLAIDASNIQAGVFVNKNVYARCIFLMALAVLVVGYDKGFFGITTVFVLALFWPLLNAESATSLMMYFFVLSFPLIYLLVINKPTKLRVGLAIGLIGMVVISVVAVPWGLGLPVATNVLELLGKDATLTGRIGLWDIGIQMFSQYPLLGIGYEAYWASEMIESRQEILNFYGERVTGFHNMYLDAAVGTGVIGFLGVAMSIVMSGRDSFRKLARKPSSSSLGVVYFISLLLLMGVVEVIGFRGNSTMHILLVSLVISIGNSRSSEGVWLLRSCPPCIVTKCQ